MNSKMVVTGDLQQSDLPESLEGGFRRCIVKLTGLAGHAALEAQDIVRHPLIAEIENRLAA